MKTHSILALLLTFALLFSLAPPGNAAVTGRSEDTSLAGTERLLSDSSGVDTFITVSTLNAAQTYTAGLTATGSSAWNFSGSTGAFQTSSGLNTFNGSGHAFAAILYPTANDGAALGSSTLSFSDLFLAAGAVINFNNSNVLLTHSTGVLTFTNGDLRIATAGTNAASAVTVGGTQTLTSKTLTAPVIADGLTATGSAANTFASSTGTFITSTGVNTFKGSAHNFDAILRPTSNDGAALGSGALAFSDLFLASGAVININNGDWTATHSAGVLTIGASDDIRMTTAGTNSASVATVGGTQTLTSKTLTSPVIASGLTASGSGANTFASSSGTFITSTGVNTFKGSAHNFDAVLQPTTNDAAALGTTTLGFSDLHLATGAVINVANGNAVITHSSGIFTVSTGDLRVTTAGTNAASVVTVGGTQTLTGKTLTSPTMTTPTLGAAIATSVESLTSGLIFEGSTADANETTVTATDPTADRGINWPDASGVVTLAQASTAVSLTADNQAVTPGSATRIQLASDNATDTNRTFTLSATGAITGQIYVVIGPATNACEIADTGIQRLSATWSPGVGDTLTLLFDGTNFNELARSNN